MVAAKTAVAIGLLVATRVPVQQHASLAITLMTAQLAMAVRHTTQIVRHTATAITQVAQSVLHLVVAVMTAMRVQHAVMAQVATAALQIKTVLLETAKTAQRAQVLVVASATATVQSDLHTASQIHRVLKTALQSAVGQKIVAVILLAKSATQTVLTAQHAMIHANQVSVVLATQTQTRRLSSKTRFLSA
jgi:hypothetical protein